LAALPRYERATIRPLIVGASPMFREPVASSMILAVGYDEDSATLEVEFASGAVCRYHGVEPDVYEGFRLAPSKGKFFNRHIKDAYPWEKVER
jgi:KTSC domain